MRMVERILLLLRTSPAPKLVKQTLVTEELRPTWAWLRRLMVDLMDRTLSQLQGPTR